MAAPNADMAQFFDFGEAAMPDAHAQVDQDASAIQTSENQLLDAFLETDNLQTEEFNTDFSSWLPGYQKPANPCDYCRSKSLECFIYNANGDGTSGCSPCKNLYRPCSFSNPELMPYRTQRTALDTLDVVGEDDVHQFGGLTRKRQLRSKGHIGPIDDESSDIVSRKGAAASRFPRAAVKVLKDWMIAHHDHPYPTEEEKEVLGQQTGLSMGQISNWMANTRRRQKARPKRSSSPSIRPNTQALNIPAGRTWESLNPFERWKHSPPENEPAPLTAIAQAVETFDPPENSSASSSYQHISSNKSTDSFSVFRAPSLSSLETGFTNMSSGSLGSHNTAYSHGSRHSLGSMNSLKSKERRRRRRLPTRLPKDSEKDAPRPFQCTFCTDRFKSKYDWSRHEKSLHLSMEKWICAPLGEVVADTTTGKSKCVYCGELEPTKDHLATHNHSACEEKGLESRTFYRKDHLRQHLRLMHDVKMTPAMDSWKSEAQYIKSRCGFCAMDFDKWQDRVDHLSKEFRNGADMKNWKGCRGLDASVAIHVTNAMPPYLIANESKSPFPFSATDKNSCSRMPVMLGSQDLEYLLPNTTNLSDAYQGGGQNVGPIVLQNTTAQDYSSSESPDSHSRATCWEILTLRLGRFAREHIEKHGAGTVTDEMLQKEARIILYGEPDDPWHQTAADNPEWLNLFKKAHGIDHSIQVPGVHSQHEIYEDLGLGAAAQLDPSFNVNNVHAFGVLNLPANDPTRAAQFECSLSGTTNMYEFARRVASTQSPSNPGLTASTSASPTTPASRRASAMAMAPITEQICTTTDQDMSKAMDSFHIPSWDQLPSEFQDPATSSGFESTIPLDATTSAMDVSTSIATTRASSMVWDEHELSFDMDLDLDFATEMANAGMS